MDHETVASNPGRIRLQPWCWIRHRPAWPSLLACALLAAIASLPWTGLFGVVATLVALGLNRLYWKRLSEHFRYGCVNVGKVIQLRPMLVAVSTDLSKGDGKFPAIKVIEARLDRVVGLEPQVGMHLATVAVYYGDTHGECPHWTDFDPWPVEYATADVDAQQAALNSIELEEFRDLESGLARLGASPGPGLHPLWSEGGLQYRPTRDSTDARWD